MNVFKPRQALALYSRRTTECLTDRCGRNTAHRLLPCRFGCLLPANLWVNLISVHFCLPGRCARSVDQRADASCVPSTSLDAGRASPSDAAPSREASSRIPRSQVLTMPSPGLGMRRQRAIEAPTSLSNGFSAVTVYIP